MLAAERVDEALLVGHSLGGAVVSAYAGSGSCRGVINIDQPLALAGFKDVLGQLEPALRSDTAGFRAAIEAVFDQMAGPLSGAERWRVDHLRDPDQDVVLGVWELLLGSSVAELDTAVDSLVGAITVPYLSLHGIDPGPEYERWLTQRILGAIVDVWQGLGHYPHLMEPQRFVERLVAFDRR